LVLQGPAGICSAAGAGRAATPRPQTSASSRRRSIDRGSTDFETRIAVTNPEIADGGVQPRDPRRREKVGTVT
jgi:hypothetical protein